ncbi:hypothetical protein LSH36_244g00012 [Paralvinella palmiformis]|uniref:Uncharacterized protein n=1 Tax=Paralvinella palmiformis TaxID=53620 RepID=A0AAD9N4L9_9ANNE|nr:hypothetical protein LSH36_244g00012 [Paralvinella palmiformis]
MLGTLEPSHNTDWKSVVGPLVHAYARDSLPVDETDVPGTVDNVQVCDRYVTNTTMNSLDTGTDEVDTSDEEDYTLEATESPLPDDCTGGAEHVHGDTVEQSPLVSVLIDHPATPVHVENVDMDEPVHIGVYMDVLSDDETPVETPCACTKA